MDLNFDPAHLVEPKPYEEWHEDDCATHDGPPGPFPCDCKLSKGWRVFLLPPKEGIDNGLGGEAHVPEGSVGTTKDIELAHKMMDKLGVPKDTLAVRTIYLIMEIVKVTDGTDGASDQSEGST